MKTLNLLGFDFGASSGRAMLGTLADGKLEIQEIHRFSNDPVMLCGRFVWDLPRMMYEMKQALLKISHMDVKVDAIGIDTWGVDYGLLDKNGHLLGLPVHYRDDRTLGMREKVREIIPDAELFARTGLAYNQFNTLYQLYAMRVEGDPTLDAAADLLFMPDLLAWLLTGEKGTEYTIASTSQLLNPYTRDWDRELLEKLDIPTRMLGEVKLPGTVRGTLLPEIARECGVDEIPVIAVGGHDTASAVAAVPARDEDFAYISSGTWSLLGAEIQKPLCEESVMKANYTNEGGVNGSIRLLKNIMGLWIIQECKREWDRRSDAVGFAELVEMAVKAPAFKAMIDVFHLNIEEKDIYQAIRDYNDINIHVHLSDNNRRYPGNCGMDFEKIIQTFHDVGYDDLFCTEVFQYPSMEECARRSIAYLAPIFEKVYGRRPRA